jgi:hypothetical protein
MTVNAQPTIKQKIIGGFELAFLFGRGVQNYSGTRPAALRSLAIPAAGFILHLIVQAIWPYPPKGMETGFSYWQIARTDTAHFLISCALTFAFLYYVSGLLERRAKFWLWLEATCWAGLAGTFITLPIALIEIFSWAPREVMDRVDVICTLYNILVTACIVYASLRINWYLAAGIAMGTLAIGNELTRILLAVQGIPFPWDY